MPFLQRKKGGGVRLVWDKSELDPQIKHFFIPEDSSFLTPEDRKNKPKAQQSLFEQKPAVSRSKIPILSLSKKKIIDKIAPLESQELRQGKFFTEGQGCKCGEGRLKLKPRKSKKLSPNQKYYFTHSFFCTSCKRIFIDDAFKKSNPHHLQQVFDKYNKSVV